MCRVPFEKCTVRFDPTYFVLFRNIDFHFGAGIRNPKIWTSSTKRPILSTTFLRLATGLPVTLSILEHAFIAEFANRFCFVMLNIRKDANGPMTESCSF